MPAHAFWVIVDGITPTAFRAKQRDALVPTFKQLQRTQPTVALRWFDRGQLWESPIAAREALEAKRRLQSERKPNWRPGGDHVDPRERYQLTRDQKRAKFKRLRSRKPGSSGASGGGAPRALKKEPWKSESQKAGKPGSWGARNHPRRPPRGPKRDR